MDRYEGGFNFYDDEGQPVGHIELRSDLFGDGNLVVGVIAAKANAQMVLGLEPEQADELAGALQLMAKAQRNSRAANLRIRGELDG